MITIDNFLRPIFILLLALCVSCDRNSSQKTGNLKLADSNSPPALPQFSDITRQAGLGAFRHVNGAFGKMWFPEQMGAGCGVIDYDGDGWLDILLVGGGALAKNTIPPTPALFLYRNKGDGTFELKTKEAGLDNIFAWGTGICVADYDNDGDADFLFTTLQENKLYNNHEGVFTDVTKHTGLDKPVLWSSSALFFDANKDGWLDLYVGNYARWTPETDIRCSLDKITKVYCAPGMYHGIPSSFYLSNGDGTFRDMTEEAGFLPAPGKSLGVSELDHNQDGWPDFVVANDGEGDLLYENNGDGTFTEKGMISGMAYGENGEARAGMGIDTGVVDESGQVSIFVGNFSGEMIGVYRYSKNGWFADRAAISKIGRKTLNVLTFGLLLMDMDFDGDLDLFVANGHVYPVRTKIQKDYAYKQPAQIFVNNGKGIFEEVSDKIGGSLRQKMVARGTAYGDFDRDGDPDILITENGGPVHLWRNDFKAENFLRVKLEGRKTNRNAYGTRIVAIVNGKKMFRRVRSGSGYLSHSESVVTFGLHHQTKVDSLAILWLNSPIEIFTDVPANQEIKIVEGTNKIEQISLAVKP